MQIIIKSGEYTYSYDGNANDKVVDGELEPYYTPVEEAVDAALMLLGCLYDKAKISEYIKGYLPAKDY